MITARNSHTAQDLQTPRTKLTKLLPASEEFLPFLPATSFPSFLSSAKAQLKAAAGPWLRSRTKRRSDLPPSLWNLSPVVAADGEQSLGLRGLPLHDLLQRWGSPLHVVDAAKLAANIDDFQAIPDGLPTGCEVYYSYKTNPIPGVLQFMHQRGVGAEVISAFELWLAFHLGVPPDKIIYNGPAKSDASLREAIAREILLININHREEIQRIARIAAEVGRTARVGVRISGASGWSAQFGIPIAGGQARDAVAEALAAPGLDVVALHAHRGARMQSMQEVRTHVQQVLAFADAVHAEFGLDLEMLDVGGSLAIPTVRPLTHSERRLNQTFLCDLLPPDPHQRPTIRDYVAGVAGMIHRHYAERGRPLPRIVLEPGRAMTGNTQMLVCSVIGIKRAPSEDFTYAILDAGINIADYVQTELHQLFPANKYGNPPAGIYRLVGPICQPGDVLYPAWELPELAIGDSLAIMDSGAYFVPSANSFSFPQPAIVMVHGEGSEAMHIASASASGSASPVSVSTDIDASSPIATRAPTPPHVSLLRRAETFVDRVGLDEMG